MVDSSDPSTSEISVPVISVLDILHYATKQVFSVAFKKDILAVSVSSSLSSHEISNLAQNNLYTCLLATFKDEFDESHTTKHPSQYLLSPSWYNDIFPHFDQIFPILSSFIHAVQNDKYIDFSHQHLILIFFRALGITCRIQSSSHHGTHNHQHQHHVTSFTFPFAYYFNPLISDHTETLLEDIHLSLSDAVSSQNDSRLQQIIDTIAYQHSPSLQRLVAATSSPLTELLSCDVLNQFILQTPQHNGDMTYSFINTPSEHIATQLFDVERCVSPNVFSLHQSIMHSVFSKYHNQADHLTIQTHDLPVPQHQNDTSTSQAAVRTTSSPSQSNSNPVLDSTSSPSTLQVGFLTPCSRLVRQLLSDIVSFSPDNSKSHVTPNSAAHVPPAATLRASVVSILTVIPFLSQLAYNFFTMQPEIFRIRLSSNSHNSSPYDDSTDDFSELHMIRLFLFFGQEITQPSNQNRSSFQHVSQDIHHQPCLLASIYYFIIAISQFIQTVYSCPPPSPSHRLITNNNTPSDDNSSNVLPMATTSTTCTSLITLMQICPALVESFLDHCRGVCSIASLLTFFSLPLCHPILLPLFSTPSNVFCAHNDPQKLLSAFYSLITPPHLLSQHSSVQLSTPFHHIHHKHSNYNKCRLAFAAFPMRVLIPLIWFHSLCPCINQFVDIITDQTTHITTASLDVDIIRRYFIQMLPPSQKNPPTDQLNNICEFLAICYQNEQVSFSSWNVEPQPTQTASSWFKSWFW